MKLKDDKRRLIIKGKEGKDYRKGSKRGIDWIEDTDMSFCRGSVNCHGSDGQMYHFCESSRSGEIFLDQYRGVGVFIPRDKFIRIGLFRSVNRPSVASES